MTVNATRKAFIVILIVTAGGALRAQQSAPLTIPQVLSYPYPGELVAAPSGARIAWTLKELGVRSIWSAAAPEWTPRRLTRNAADDGQELSQLSISADGKTLVYVRGGDHGANWPAEGGLPPDPAHSPQLPKVEIWAVSTSGDSAPRVVAEGDEPAISPRGDRVAFTRGGQVYSVPLAGGEAKQLFFARGTSGGLKWSPDGTSLAFVSTRGAQSFIGLFTSDSAPIRYLAPAASYDFEIRWSPDGKRIAFVRYPGQGGTPAPYLTLVPQPWAIWSADVATGTAHEVWRSPNTLRGSFPETAGDANLGWGAGDRIVFLSDMDGWPHLYSVPERGGTPLLLTPGNFMVEHVAFSSDQQFIVYSANAGADPNDDDRRHLFRVPVDRAAPAALSPGDGVEWTPVVAGDRSAAAFISAGPKRPPQVAVLALSAKAAPKLLGSDRIPADFPAASFVVPKKIVFKAADGTTVHGQLFERPGLAGKHAALIFVHGGPPRQMILGWHYMEYYSHAYAMNQYLASRGFVVMSVNYRLGIGYGHDFHHPPHAGPAGAAEYQDVLAGGKYLASLPEVDARRVGIWGGSYGGYLTALALARNSDVFAAGVDLHGVHDWVADLREYYAPPAWQYERGDLDSAKAVAWASSPVSSIDTWKSPVLLIHGDDDRNVRYSQTVDLARRLDAAGVRYELLVFPDEIHDFLLHRSWLAADAATVGYFERVFGTP